MTADPVRIRLEAAEAQAFRLLHHLEEHRIIRHGITEKALSREIVLLARTLLGVKRHWHKRIVRAGENTLLPYKHNPPDLIIQEDDILFLDLGPILEDTEADIGRTYVLGNDPQKHRLITDAEAAWVAAAAYWRTHPSMSGAMLYRFIQEYATAHGWVLGGEMAGHLIGIFPHEKLPGGSIPNYIHPENHLPMDTPYPDGSARYWILEIHFTNPEKKIGAFVERMLK